jgi:hypothetical protein
MEGGTHYILHSLRGFLQVVCVGFRFGTNSVYQSQSFVSYWLNQFNADHFINDPAWIDSRRIPLHQGPNAGSHRMKVADGKLASSPLRQTLCLPSAYYTHHCGSPSSNLHPIDGCLFQELRDVVSVDAHPDRYLRVVEHPSAILKPFCYRVDTHGSQELLGFGNRHAVLEQQRG